VSISQSNAPGSGSSICPVSGGGGGSNGFGGCNPLLSSEYSDVELLHSPPISGSASSLFSPLATTMPLLDSGSDGALKVGTPEGPMIPIAASPRTASAPSPPSALRTPPVAGKKNTTAVTSKLRRLLPSFSQRRLGEAATSGASGGAGPSSSAGPDPLIALFDRVTPPATPKTVDAAPSRSHTSLFSSLTRAHQVLGGGINGGSITRPVTAGQPAVSGHTMTLMSEGVPLRPSTSSQVLKGVRPSSLPLVPEETHVPPRRSISFNDARAAAAAAAAGTATATAGSVSGGRSLFPVLGASLSNADSDRRLLPMLSRSRSSGLDG